MGSSENKQAPDTFDDEQSVPYVYQAPYSIDNNRISSNNIYRGYNYTLHTGPPLTMPIQPTYKCSQCGMVFASDEALYKHRTRFCIANPNSGMRRNLTYSTDGVNHNYTTENNRTSQPTSRTIPSYPSPVDKKMEEINEWKSQRSILQSVQDMEDKILLDSKKTEKMVNDLKKRNQEYNQILREYEQLQEQERHLLREMFDLHGQSRLYLSQPKDLNEYEKNQLGVLYRQNTRIKRDRQHIQDKLETFIANDKTPSMLNQPEPHRLLLDMKQQQERNEKNLSYLRMRLLHNNGLSSTTDDSSILPRINFHRQPTVADVRMLHSRYLQSGGLDNDILKQFADLEDRLRQYEAAPWLKDYPEPLSRYPYQPVLINEPTNDHYFILDANEKGQLKSELNDMQRTKQLELTLATNQTLNSARDKNQNRYVSSTGGDYGRGNTLTQTNPAIYNNSSSNVLDERRLYANSTNNFLNQHSTYTNSTNNFPNQHPVYANSTNSFSNQPSIYANSTNNFPNQHPNPQQSSLPLIDVTNRPRGIQSENRISSNPNRQFNAIEPRPYDPVGGFVIYFDFIINLPPYVERCQLITCLHHAETGLGQPSALALCQSELAIDEQFGEPVGVVLIATKQPVPRCPPQQGLSIVIEILTTSKQTPNITLRTNAWVKLPLFDANNRLLSGRWRVPLKALPIQHGATLPVIATLPTFGRAELHYRLVNADESAKQANVPFSPKFRDLYLIPPQD